MLADYQYYNCDLPSTIRLLLDPEVFYQQIEPCKIIIFDEIHKLQNPSEVLKIGADEFPHLKILATGSSTLAATSKFKDSLTGRKTSIYLPPVLWTECLQDFKILQLDKRLYQGGLPEELLAGEKNLSFFSEWLDSFYARDIQELFSIRNRTGFLKLLNLVLRQSGGLIDYAQLAKLSDISRPTVKAHIEALMIANALFLLSPYHGGGRREITQQPKFYAFDTGFVTYAKGWSTIREEDRGLLWEHLVLDAFRCFIHLFSIYYWRDKSGREIDFVITGMDNRIHAIECKLNQEKVNIQNLRAFRSLYPDGKNVVVSPFIDKAYKQKKGELLLEFVPLQDILKDHELLS
jgi:hypothetical protein